MEVDSWRRYEIKVGSDSLKFEMKVKVLKALSHPIRLKIIDLLKDGRRCVCEIQPNVNHGQSNLSQHLKILKDANIITQEKEGPKVFYEVKYEEVFEILKLTETVVDKQVEDILSVEE